MNIFLDLDAEAEVERCGALRDAWYVACLSESLERSRPLARTFFDKPLVLIRDAHGAPVAFDDRCLHRGTPLSRGEVKDGCLRCPYHGWTYDSRGNVKHVPSLGPEQRSASLSAVAHQEAGLCERPADLGALRVYPTAEVDGLVYVFMGKRGNAPPRAPFGTPHYGEPGWRTYYMVTRFTQGVTHLVENFMDVPHTVDVHRGWFRRAAHKQVPATVQRQDGPVLVTYHQQSDVLTGMGRLLNPSGAPMVHTDHFFAPHITRVDYAFGPRAGFCITSQCTPVGPKDTWVTTAIGYRLPVDAPGSPLARLLEPWLRAYTRRVIAQDVHIMALQGTRLSGRMHGQHLRGTEADLVHREIESVRAWMRDGALQPGLENRTQQIVFWV
jgi:phenylpropionate dioxygenase-like ring-hydroxylating dioxygenase large terminal subunit